MLLNTSTHTRGQTCVVKHELTHTRGQTYVVKHQHTHTRSNICGQTPAHTHTVKHMWSNTSTHTRGQTYVVKHQHTHARARSAGEPAVYFWADHAIRATAQRTLENARLASSGSRSESRVRDPSRVFGIRVARVPRLRAFARGTRQTRRMMSPCVCVCVCLCVCVCVWARARARVRPRDAPNPPAAGPAYAKIS